MRRYSRGKPYKSDIVLYYKRRFQDVMCAVESLRFSSHDLSENDKAYENFMENVDLMCVYEKESENDNIMKEGILSPRVIDGRRRRLAMMFLKNNNIFVI